MAEYIERASALAAVSLGANRGQIAEYIREIPAADVFERPKWVSVEDALPTAFDEETWVMFEGGNISTDTWQMDRGDHGAYLAPCGEPRPFVHSGWYHYDSMDHKIIKWAPMVAPEPKEDA